MLMHCTGPYLCGLHVHVSCNSCCFEAGFLAYDLADGF